MIFLEKKNNDKKIKIGSFSIRVMLLGILSAKNWNLLWSKKYPKIKRELLVVEAKKIITLAMVVTLIESSKKNIKDNLYLHIHLYLDRPQD